MSTNLANINKRIDFLSKKSTSALMFCGELVRGHFIKSWEGGIGGDGKSMKPLSNSYAIMQKDGDRTPNMRLSHFDRSKGSGVPLVDALTKWSDKVNEVFVGWRDLLNQNKARGNFKLRNGMMLLSQKAKDAVVKIYYERMTK
jgi:hypothetical protein